ncbi:hypothetical protein BJV78DRAFT_1330530 [Lactifluus subvellereus]|nr:hypothetical protein BJV78DRAFT_1330530 [Lactifluus subvellereus]
MDPSIISSLSSSDRRAIRNRQRDPDWVPRPRNAFIIFRCEYSRKHARDPSDSSDSDKTLSKRAGEEWRRLSAAEREQYKILAEQEKAAHALQNPDYRFKPVRRPPLSMVSTAARARQGTCRRNDRSAQVASLIMRSERGAPSLTRDENPGIESPPELITAQAPPSTGAVIGRRRSASMPQPLTAEKVVTLPVKPRTPGPISCTSSPGPTAFDFDMVSSSSMDDSPLYTPVLPTSPPLHTLPSGFPMVPLPEHPSPLSEAFQCGMDIGSTRNSSLPLSATSGAYAYTDTTRGLHQQFSFADIDLYPPLLEATTAYTDWVCGAPTESCPAFADATTALPKSHDTGASGPFGPPPLPIPFIPQPTTSAVHEIPAAFWGADYTEPANMSAMFGGAPGLTAVIPEALPVGYDTAAAQVGLDEFINTS